MKINREICSKCGKCVSECPNKAIIKNEDGNYIIDSVLCTECTDLPDQEPECFRHCPLGSMVLNNGEVPVKDTVPRLRAEHAVWIMAIMGARDSDKFKSSHWDLFRKLAARFYTEPDLVVRLTKYLDDNCYGCMAKQKAGHLEESGQFDDLCHEKLGLKFGEKIKLWDLIRMIEEKFSAKFISKFAPDYVIEYYKVFASPKAEALKE